MSLSLVNNALQVLAFLTLVGILVRRKIPAWWSWGLAGAALLALASFTYQGFPRGVDAKSFYIAGRAVWEGDDPYARSSVLHPPTALPVFALMAVGSFISFLAVWTVLNIVGYAAVVPFTQAAIHDPQDTDPWEMAPPDLAVLTATVAVCYSTRHAMILGQLPLATILILLAALWCQGRNRPIGAGLCLAVASMKVNTMMPFLLLFLRKRDWPAWATMIMAVLALSLVTAPTELPARLSGCLNNIASEPGRVGNNSIFPAEGKINVELISFDHAVYHLGVRDLTMVRLVALALVVLLGAWVTWEALRPPAVGRAARCSLIGAYAAVFLYHRGYDMVVLVIPLVYAAGRAVTVAGRVRWLYGASALACVLVLDLRVSMLERLSAFARVEGTGSRLLEAIVLPYGTWLVVALIVMLVAAERYAGEQTRESYRTPPSPA
jgi:hypothetical protein